MVDNVFIIILVEKLLYLWKNIQLKVTLLVLGLML